MIAGNKNETFLHTNEIPKEKYHYLFRTWRNLLTSASEMKNIWINDFDKKKQMIIKLHTRLQKFKLTEEEEGDFEDDLPKFLLKLDGNTLQNLLFNIQNNLVEKEDASCLMYTIHAYKGMEYKNIRIFDELDPKEEQNLYYVALTRGIEHIYLDY